MNQMRALRNYTVNKYIRNNQTIYDFFSKINAKIKSSYVFNQRTTTKLIDVIHEKNPQYY